MKVKGKARIILVNDDDEKVFGKGPYVLLNKVKECGSLNKAAIELGMSYSKAFNVIKKCEKSMNKKFLDREIGGVKGGGSTLTEDGERVLENYEIITREINKRLDELTEELEF